MSIIVTHSGRHINLAAPFSEKSDPVDLDDIANGLAKQCRFNGQINKFYSVAEHSILVSRLVPDALALPALMHDAAEAFLGDIVSPLKGLISGYDKIEHQLMCRISDDLDFEWPLLSRIDRNFIKNADLLALRSEKETFYPDEPEWPVLKNTGEFTFKLECMNWMDARLAFIGRYHELKQN